MIFPRWGTANLLLFLMLMLRADSAWPQTSQAVLQGQVTEAGGGPLAGALVLLRNRLTNSPAYRYTNARGLFFFSAVFPGIYSVRVDALGYQLEERSSVELSVGSHCLFSLECSAVVQPSRH